MKYKLLEKNENGLYRIEALKDFGNVKKGDIGGFIESENNLSQNGNAWVFGDARVSGNAWVYGNAWVFGDARVSGNAWVYGDAWVFGNACVSGNARVYGDAWVYGNAWVYGDARVSGNAWVYGDACVSGNAQVCGDAQVFGCAVATKSVHNIKLTYNITLTDNHIQIGCKQYTFEKALKLHSRWKNTLENIEEAKEIENDKAVIVALIKHRMAENVKGEKR